jgi:nitrogenase molybdenum-iron protein alpha/beta subunit
MSTTLREIARLLVARGAPAELIGRTEALVNAEEARAWERIRAYKQRLAGKKVLLITGGVKSWSVVSALQEAGLEVVGTSVKKSTQEDKDKIREIMGDDAHMIDDMTPREMYAMLREARADIMLERGAQPVRGPEGPHALDGHQPGAAPRFRRLRRHGHDDRRDRQGAVQPGVGTGAHARALGNPRRAARAGGLTMALVVEPKKACAVNPLKMSQPLGAAYAFMGLASCMPVMHGSQGCTSFGLVLLVRHFKEAIPLQTTAMNEATTIMGGYDNVAKALLNIRQRNHPDIIALCSTGLTETKGDDVLGYVATARQKHPELADTEIVYVSTPDYVGAFQDGWARAVTALVEQVPRADSPRCANRIAVLPGSHLSPGDIDELRELIEAFGLEPVFVPDVSGSLDGHIPEQWLGTTLGGTPLAGLRELGGAMHALAIGEQMRPAALALQQRCGCPSRCSTG